MDSCEVKEYSSDQEALQATDSIDAATLEQEKKLLWKLDRKILPLTCSLYLFSFLDRTNLGNARLMGLPRDTLGGDPTGVLFDWATSAFFITFMLSQVPITVLSKRFSPRLWLGCFAIAWGTCSTLMATTFDFSGLIATRLALGLCEAGFGPTLVLYLSFYYTRAEYGARIAYWFGFASVAGAFSGLIAFGVQHAKVSIANWRLLFIVEGVPTILVGIYCLFALLDRPESTHSLNAMERKLAIARMNRGTSGDVGKVINKRHVLAAFLDWRVYAFGVMYFGLFCATGSIGAFLPTIIATMGYTDAMAQLLTVPPYTVATVVLVSMAYTSDRIQSRGLFVFTACLLSGIGYVLLLFFTHNQRIRYFAIFCATTGAFSGIGLSMAWFTHNLGSESKRATGVSLCGAIGQGGSILGSHLYPLTEQPEYRRGLTVSGSLLLVSALCALILTVSYRWDNKQRDKQVGNEIIDPDATVDTSEQADKAVRFRYIP
ncbi:MFS general substrate transporter [Rhizopogon vinicolor AM-OR11-026]|uniref:MFS general substrate transporter n=1 Tax=Rhizopogon vinicolor AM-OR11-026 TaxID=1314800 RepID=A0A1B7MKP4_9AGAM|nr:MFS general substrate transporter [Rhizopogon vinicolor AM-OR11-026]